MLFSFLFGTKTKGFSILPGAPLGIGAAAAEDANVSLCKVDDDEVGLTGKSLLNLSRRSSSSSASCLRNIS